jgi:hypothetical protein
MAGAGERGHGASDPGIRQLFGFLFVLFLRRSNLELVGCDAQCRQLLVDLRNLLDAPSAAQIQASYAGRVGRNQKPVRMAIKLVAAMLKVHAEPL